VHDFWKLDSSFISVAYWVKAVRRCFQENEVKVTYVLQEHCHHLIAIN